jgi:hypothetical protein
MHKVTVPCKDVIVRYDLLAWARERGMNVVNKQWDVVNERQHVTFTFDQESDATMFALRWV